MTDSRGHDSSAAKRHRAQQSRWIPSHLLAGPEPVYTTPSRENMPSTDLIRVQPYSTRLQAKSRCSRLEFVLGAAAFDAERNWSRLEIELRVLALEVVSTREQFLTTRGREAQFSGNVEPMGSQHFRIRVAST